MKRLTRVFGILMIFTLCLCQSQVFAFAKGNCKTSTGYFDAIFVTPENNQKEVQTKYLQVIVSFSEKDIQPGCNFNKISISNGAEISKKEIGSDGSLILELSKIEQIKKCKYTVKIPEGAIKDNSGKVNRAFTTRFTTRGMLYLDIVDTSPANRQVDIDVNTKVVLTFNELGLFEGPKFGNISINKGAKISSVQLDNNGTTGTITFSGLKPGVSYNVVIPEGAVQNSAGIYNRKYVLGFKTAKDKNFSVLSTTPRNLQQSVKAKENTLLVKFDADNLSEGESFYNIHIVDEKNSGGPFGIELDKKTSTVKLQPTFDYSTTYTVFIPEGAVVDNNGAKNKEYSFSFTTEKRPDVFMDTLYTIPSNGATNVDINTHEISLRFDTNEKVVTGYKGISIPGINMNGIYYNKNTPTIQCSGLKKNTKYLVTIPEGAFVDAKGIYNKAFEFSFTTAP